MGGRERMVKKHASSTQQLYHQLVSWPEHPSLLRTSTATTCRYDPGTTVQDDIDTPGERMQFLQAAAQALYTKARLKLNIKRLYAADGKAVAELLKVTDLLFVASKQAASNVQVLHVACLEFFRTVCFVNHIRDVGPYKRDRSCIRGAGAPREDNQNSSCGRL